MKVKKFSPAPADPAPPAWLPCWEEGRLEPVRNALSRALRWELSGLLVFSGEAAAVPALLLPLPLVMACSAESRLVAR